MHTGYGPEALRSMNETRQKLQNEFRDLSKNIVIETEKGTDPNAQEYLRHGAARRLMVIHHAMDYIFDNFPPTTSTVKDPELLTSIEIHLHAFMVNLFGIFDNFAWAYIYQHGLRENFLRKNQIGLFLKETKKYLPTPIIDFIESEAMTEWHKTYLLYYRDSLAHRIPLYIPPAQITPENGIIFNQLENEKIDCIQKQDWPRLSEIEGKQKAVELVCLSFLHSYREDEKPRPVMLHPQLLSDCLTVLEFGKMFMQNWNLPPRGIAPPRNS